MMTIATALAALDTQRDNLAANLTTKGVTAANTETLSQLVPKVLDITGGGTPAAASPSDINFIDFDGTIVASWTLAELATATELPANPTHAGLTAQGWNWTLTQLKTENRAADVGQMYVTDDGKTRLYITIATTGRMTLPFYWNQTVAGGVTVDWGDGSTTETFTGTGNKTTTHAYTAAGDYVITLTVTAGTLGFGTGSSASAVFGLNNAAVRVYFNMLKKVEIGSGVTVIDNYAFQYCHALTSITIPTSVTSIGNYTFNGCYSLTSITIPTSMTSIGTYVFQYCYALTSITIPASVTSISNYTFNGCYSLTSITIPTSVTAIGQYAFRDCSALTSITIPTSVTSISGAAFMYCSGAAEYHLKPLTPPTLASTTAFSNIQADCVIYVPTDSLAAYQAATYWSSFASKMVGE